MPKLSNLVKLLRMKSQTVTTRLKQHYVVQTIKIILILVMFECTMAICRAKKKCLISL